MKKVLGILAIGLVLAATGCSKEKKLEHRLERKDGKWDITTLTETSYENGAQTDVYSQSNAGTMTFDDGKVTLTTNEGSDSYTVVGSYTNTGDQISMSFDGESAVFKVTSSKKDQLELEQEDVYTFDNVTYRDVYHYTLQR